MVRTIHPKLCHTAFYVTAYRVARARVCAWCGERVCVRNAYSGPFTNIKSMFSFWRSQFDPLTPSGDKGYLAFPEGVPRTTEQRLKALKNHSRSTNESKKLPSHIGAEKTNGETDEIKERNWKRYLEEESRRRRLCEEREREQALIGEKHWIRQGGILRDKDGRRDYERTELVRKIVEREDAERRIRERWENYESAWLRLMSRSPSKELKTVTFKSIPWPLIIPPTSNADLHDQSKISEFLFESLTLEGNKTTRKERIRASLLRWHPDKLHGVLTRVPEEELEEVKIGVDTVIMALMKIQEAEKVIRQ